MDHHREGLVAVALVEAKTAGQPAGYVRRGAGVRHEGERDLTSLPARTLWSIREVPQVLFLSFESHPLGITCLSSFLVSLLHRL